MIYRVFRMTPYFVRQQGQLTAILAMSLLLSASAVLHPWPMKVLVDYGLGLGELAPHRRLPLLEALADYPAPALIAACAGATLILFALNAVVDAALSWLWMAAGQRMVYDLAGDVYEHLLHLPIGYHRRHHVGDHLERLSGDTWSVYSLASTVLVTPVQQCFILVGVGWASWHLNPAMCALSLTAAPLVALSVRYFGPRLKQKAKQDRVIRSQLSSFVQQTMSAIPVVQAFGAEERNRGQFNSLAGRVVAVSQRGVLINKSFALVNGLATETARAAVLLYGGILALNGRLSPGSLLLYLAYVRTLQVACTRLLEAYAKLRTIEASVDRLLEVLDEPKTTEAAARHTAPHCLPDRLGICLTSVSFEYVPGRPVLQDVSIRIGPGRRVALVGPSGSGKSTLASLIPRLLDPTSGRVEVAGTDVRDLTLDSLRAHVALLSQDPFILPFSVAENIALGRRGASREEIIGAAKAAMAHEFIECLPNGYDTILGQRGATLSGGQKQRIAIARALLRDAPIVILDEPSSALDVVTERELSESFEKVLQGRTSLVISHRLSSVRNADEIFVLADGRLIEAGSHEELIANGDHYSRLWAAQTGRPKHEVPA